MRRARVVSIIVGVIALVLAGGAAYLLLGQRERAQPGVTDFSSCAAAGNPITQTSPRQCRAANGTVYTEPIRSGGDEVVIREFTSPKGVTIRLNDWTERPTIASPLTLRGEVPGNWSFEGRFPVVLSDPTGKIIGQTTGELEGDWMTSQYVPFVAVLSFEVPPAGGNGMVILRKDNPSGLPENDDAIEIPITFSAENE